MVGERKMGRERGGGQGWSRKDGEEKGAKGR
jgi:hypothetical protein